LSRELLWPFQSDESDAAVLLGQDPSSESHRTLVSPTSS
jgi:hypothetical protein